MLFSAYCSASIFKNSVLTERSTYQRFSLIHGRDKDYFFNLVDKNYSSFWPFHPKKLKPGCFRNWLPFLKQNETTIVIIVAAKLKEAL